MLSLKFAYLIGDLLFFIPWVVFYLSRKDLRKEMITMSIIAGIGSFLTAYFLTIDWWKPLTITGTRIGIEDLMLGVTGGIAAVLYEEFFRKRLYKRDKKLHNKGLILIIMLTIVTFGIFFLGFRLSSFIACISSLAVFVFIVSYLRKDLLIASLINGALMTLIVIPFYLVLVFLFKNFIEVTYPYKLSGFQFLTIPIEELVFWFFFGMAVTLFYEYWQGMRLRAIPPK